MANAATRWLATSSTASAANSGATTKSGRNQLDSLGLVVNLIALWQTVYMQAALDHLSATRYDTDPADIAHLTPLGHPTINLDGHYRTTSRPPIAGLRPLRTGD